MNRSDLYQTVTDKILAALETAKREGEMKLPWRVDASSLAPANIETGKPYRGINTLLLYIAGSEAGYRSNLWGTYRQWAEIGAQVRKGERSTSIVFWRMLWDGEGDADADHPADDQAQTPRFITRGYNVFNAAQVEGYVLPDVVVLDEAERDAKADAFLQATGAIVRHGGGRAYYSPSGDYIQLPAFADFVDAGSYYLVRAHETTHWTGAVGRCDRKFSQRFGDQAYAFEELVAEIGSAFLCAQLGLSSEPREDHAHYLANWIKILKDDKRAIFTAASKAQEAVDWLREITAQVLTPEPEPEQDDDQAKDTQPGYAA